jgi:4,5-dihydroxyphthalate decarboxylase
LGDSAEAGSLDAFESSLASFLIRLSNGDDRFVGLPLFPYKAFRHSMLWVSQDGDIDRPALLRGRRVGIGMYASTALVYLRGVLQHDYGVSPDSIDWVSSERERPEVELPALVRVQYRPSTQSLSERLADGEFDAIADFWKLREVERALPIRRLWHDVRSTEREYYERTGILPIMHLILIRREVRERTPDATITICRAFQQAAATLLEELLDNGAGQVSQSPWAYLQIEDDWRVIGRAHLAQGLTANEPALRMLISNLHEQGLIGHPLTLEDAFDPEAVRLLQ